MINHMRLNFLCRTLSWLWCGSHTSRLAQVISRDCFQYNLLKSPVLRAETPPPERIASHDSHQPIRVSDCSVVSGFYSCPFFALISGSLRSAFCWLSGGSNVIVRSRPPGAGVNSIFCPVLGSKLKPCCCGPKQTHRPQSIISVTAIKGRRQLTFLLSMTIGFPVSILCAQDPLSLVIHQCCTHIHVKKKSFKTQTSTSCRTVLHAAVSIPNVIVRCAGSNRSG